MGGRARDAEGGQHDRNELGGERGGPARGRHDQGYSREELEAGRSLADALSVLHSATSTSLGNQKGATQATTSGLKEARKALIRFRTRSRSVFPKASSPEAWGALKLTSAIPKRTESFITFGYNMVDEALKNPTILSALTSKGYGQEKLNSIRALVGTVEVNNSGQEQKKGERKGTTVSRDQQLKDTVQWWSAFRRMARQTLTPVQLTSIGLN